MSYSSLEADDPRVVAKTRELAFFCSEPGAGVILLGFFMEPDKAKQILMWLLSLGGGVAMSSHPNPWMKVLAFSSATSALTPFGDGKYLRFFFGMATVMRVLRVVEVLMNAEFFEERGAMYTTKFCFLYHDLRRASFIDTKQAQLEVENDALVDIGRNSLGLLGMMALLRLSPLSSSRLSVPFLSMLRFYFFISLVEAGYRFHLCKFQIRASKCFDAPWRSKTVAEFWGKRWNLAIAQQLRNIFFKPLAQHGYRKLGELSVFMASSALHMIPIVTLGGSGKAILSTALFFILQPVVMTAEKTFNLHGRIWVHCALWSLAPLFSLPLNDVM